MKISFVIPVYNRAGNLACVLRALELQTVQGFEVIVADDGSTDDLYATLDPAYWETFGLKYYRHQNRGCRLSLIRNQGTRVVRSGTDYLWYIDSDVLLPRNAVEIALELLGRHKGRVVAGRYDWLPPMRVTPEDVEFRWKEILSCSRPPLSEPDGVVWGGRFSPQHPYNIDHRGAVDWASDTVSPCSGAMLTGNLLVPYEAWLQTGGFDENIEAQGEDAEFGRHCEQEGFEMVFSDAIGGYHLYHSRDVRALTMGVRKSIEYVRKKYGLPFDPEKHLPPLPAE